MTAHSTPLNHYDRQADLVRQRLAEIHRLCRVSPRPRVGAIYRSRTRCSPAVEVFAVSDLHVVFRPAGAVLAQPEAATVPGILSRHEFHQRFDGEFEVPSPSPVTEEGAGL